MNKLKILFKLILNYFGNFTDWKISWISWSRLLKSRIRYNTSLTKIKYLFGYFTEFVTSLISQLCKIAFLPPSHIFWQKQYFLSKYCFCFSKSSEITMNWEFQFTWRKNIAGKMSFYRNITLSFYRNIARQNCSSDEGLKL